MCTSLTHWAVTVLGPQVRLGRGGRLYRLFQGPETVAPDPAVGPVLRLREKYFSKPVVLNGAQVGGRGDSPQVYLAMLLETFVGDTPQGVGMLLASSGWRPRMMRNTLDAQDSPTPTTKNWPVPNVKSARLRDTCSEQSSAPRTPSKLQ